MKKIKLTDSKIKNVQWENGKNNRIYDTDIKNFLVRISKTKKVFIYRYRFNGQSRKDIIGEYPATTLSQARQRALEMWQLVEANIDPRLQETKEQKENEEKIKTFKICMDRFIVDHVSTLREKTRNNYKWRFDQMEEFYEMDIKKIQRVHISEFISQRKKNSLTNAVEDRKLLNNFFNWCISMGFVENNPVTHSIKYNKPKPRDRYHSDEEIRIIFENLPDADPPLDDIIRFIFHTGKRVGETIQLKYSWMHWENQTITIPDTITKNKTEDVVYLSPTIFKMIEHRFNTYHSKYIFHKNDKWNYYTKPYKGIYYRIEKYRDVTKIEDLRLHDIRRTITRLLSQMKVPAHVKDQILNNASASQYTTIRDTYDVYDYFQEKKDALLKLEVKLKEIINS